MQELAKIRAFDKLFLSTGVEEEDFVAIVRPKTCTSNFSPPKSAIVYLYKQSILGQRIDALDRKTCYHL